MIQRFRPGAVRRHLGFIGIASLMLGVAAVSQAAVTKHDQGTVVLSVLVAKDGSAGKIVAEPSSEASAELIKAAIDAVCNDGGARCATGAARATTNAATTTAAAAARATADAY
ncbi:MAG: hypothetical protein WDW38_000809 [Sanguina aurantia]